MSDSPPEPAPQPPRGHRTEIVLTVIAEFARFLMAGALIGQNAALMFFLIKNPMPDSAKDLQLLLVNGAGLLAGVAVQYYFGSSAGSAAKDRKS